MNNKTQKLSDNLYKLGSLLLVIIVIIGLIAPFTFLKPQSYIDEVLERKKAALPKNVKNVVSEKPLHNVQLPKFSNIKDVKEKKRQFFAFIRPALETQNKNILIERDALLVIKARTSIESALTIADKIFIKQVNNKYKNKTKFGLLGDIEELLVKVDIVPIPLMLVQAANESAWGTSRFARVGLNFFGLWCFDKDCGMVPGSRNKGAKHEVAVFESVEEAVTKYLHNINTHAAYKVFRAIRAQLRLQKLPLTPKVLATGLLPYSERGADYVLEISDMLLDNKQYF